VKGSDSESVLKPKHTAVGAVRDVIRRCLLALSLRRENGPRKELSGSMVAMGVLLFLVAGSLLLWRLFVHAQQTPIARQPHSSSLQASEITSRPLLTEESPTLRKESPKRLHSTNEKSRGRVKSAERTAYNHTASEPREPAGPVRQLPAGQTQISEAPQLALVSAASLPNLSSPAPLPVAPPKSQIVPAQLVRRIPPVYSEAARRLRLSGQVLLKAAISKYGTVGDVHWVNGNPVFRDVSIAAIKQWRFKPANLNGEPVESDLEVILQFSPKTE
jgi:outer membrane biosynthesis protein TonB